MTKEQHKYLIKRTSSVEWNRIPSPKDPPGIRELRKKLQRYDQKVERVMKERIACRSEAADDVRELIFSGDYGKALNALKAFEKMSF